VCGRWWPSGFVIVYPDGISKIDVDGTRTRSSAFWAP